MPIMHYNDVILSKETIVFAKSKVLSGNAFAIVLNLRRTLNNKNLIVRKQQDLEETNKKFTGELQEKHAFLFSVLLCALLLLCGITLIQCGIS